MQFPRIARRAVAACLAVAALAPPPAHAATQQEVADAVGAGAAWIRTQQDPATGQLTGFGGDYALSALAAAGVHPADVPAAARPRRTSTPASGRRQTTPSSTAILFGAAAGIDSQRLSASTNLVALLAGAYNRSGELEGSFGGGATNLDGVQRARARARGRARAGARRGATPTCAASSTPTAAGTSAASAPTRSAAAASSADMTGAVLAALCETGAAANDADVRAGLVASSRGGRTRRRARSATSTRPAGRCPGSTPAASTRRAGASRPRPGKTPADYLLSQQDAGRRLPVRRRAEPLLDAERGAGAGRRGVLGRPAAARGRGRPALPARAGRRRRDRDAARAGGRRRRRRRALLQRDRARRRVAGRVPRRRRGGLVAGGLRHLERGGRRARDRGQRARGRVAAARRTARRRAGDRLPAIAFGDTVLLRLPAVGRRHQGVPGPAGPAGAAGATGPAGSPGAGATGRGRTRRAAPARPARAGAPRPARPGHVPRALAPPRHVPRQGAARRARHADPRRPRLRRRHRLAPARAADDPPGPLHAPARVRGRRAALAVTVR